VSKNGDRVGYGLRGAVNLPDGDTSPVRVSAFDRRVPGYSDNVLSGQKGVNGGSMWPAAIW